MESYLPHGYCYLWQPGLLTLHVVSDSIITLAYYSIPLGLVYFVRKRQDLPFHWMFVLFAVFIVACGTTHLMEIWTLWHPSYWLSGGIKFVTAGASIGTAVLLVPLIPKAIALPSPAQLAAKNNELEAVNQELETFSYSVSHDLRAPLRAIDGFSRVLLEDHAPRLDEDGVRSLNVIRMNAQRMGHLIDDLLEFSRLSRKELVTAQVDMAALARAAADDLRREPELVAASATIDIGLLPPARGDAGLLQQVWANLIGNALKYSRTRREPRIEIAASEQNGDLVYSVRDNGVGFDPVYADKLFGVFQRLHSAQEFEGTGVGLALVRRILERHGGRIWADGKLDQGATFYFTLPRG
jgi:signal transduction histidine kinase